MTTPQPTIPEPTTTVRAAFYQVLRELGLTTMFGNPGSTEEPMLQDFPDDFRYILGLQEASVVAMADGYAQATGLPALVSLHTSAGVGNAMGNIVSAWHNRAPLIILAGQQTREMLLVEPLLTNLRAADLPRPYVKWSYETSLAQDAPAALIRAYAAAVQPPAGPVFLSIPMDDFDQPIAAAPPVRRVSTRLQASSTGLQHVADALAGAASPALIVGAAADCGGWDEVVRLAERLQCPVWAAPEEGRPGFPETHPLYQGPLPPAIGPLSDALSGRDVVLVVGAPVFRYYPHVPGSYLPPGTRLLQITDDPAESARAAAGDAILTDPALACGVLADLIPDPARPTSAPLRPAPTPATADSTITPEYLFDNIQRLRPDDSIVVQESLSNLTALRERIPTAAAGSFFSMASGVLGYGLPAAVGVAMAQRDNGSDRKVVCIVGDGSAQYVIQSLWTAAQQELPILFVVLRNGEYAILKSFARQQDTPQIPGLDLPGIDCVQLAGGYGCAASRVSDPSALPGALAAAMADQRPHLLEVTIDPSIPPLI